MTEKRNVDFEKRSIPFTQYLRPNGRQEPVATISPTYTDEVLRAAQEIIDADFVFTIEELSTGGISMCISDDNADYYQVICSNSPEVALAVVKLITTKTVDQLVEQREREKEQKDAG